MATVTNIRVAVIEAEGAKALNCYKVDMTSFTNTKVAMNERVIDVDVAVHVKNAASTTVSPAKCGRVSC